jgi:putative heme degradation protein
MWFFYQVSQDPIIEMVKKHFGIRLLNLDFMRSLKSTWAIIEHEIVKFIGNHNIIQILEQLLKTIQKTIKFYKSKHTQHPFFSFYIVWHCCCTKFLIG